MPLNLDLGKLRFGTELLKRGFARMQKGGVIMDVTTAEQAAIAEEAGAVAVMALERVPADIREAGGVARMADPQRIVEIMNTVTIPVMAKVRIGHAAEAAALEVLGVDMIDESEVLTPADPYFHIDKRLFKTPFVSGARNLGEAVRRIHEGSAMIRTKGEAGTGDVVEAVRHQRMINVAIQDVAQMDSVEVRMVAEHLAQGYRRLLEEVRSLHGSPKAVVEDVLYGSETFPILVERLSAVLGEIRQLRRLPVVNFAAGGLATPADGALMMQLGCDGVFVGSGIFKSENPEVRARAIVEAVTHYDDPAVVAEVSKGLGEPMRGMDITSLSEAEKLQVRGW